MTEDEMVGGHYQFNRHELEQMPGDGVAQGGLACCSPRGPKESDTTGLLNNNKLVICISSLEKCLFKYFAHCLSLFELL